MSKIKKILLVNDMRGSHEYLYRAFLRIGIECDIALFGTSTVKPIPNALDFDPFRRLGLLGKPIRPLLNIYNLKKLGNYDVASFVHRISFIDKPYLLRFKDLPLVRDKVRVMSYTGLGCDEISFVADNDSLPYKPCDTCQKYDDPDRHCELTVRPMKNLAVDYLNLYFDSVFSTMVEYGHISKSFKGEVQRIPLPLDVGEIPWAPVIINKNRKIRIIHTPSRSGFKGTHVVLAAIEILSKTRSGDFEFKVVTGLNFADYIKEITSADIVIDQVWSQSPGMNALWLLGMGKIVFSGNTSLSKNYFNFSSESPIYDAPPEPAKLAAELSKVISLKNSFPRISEAGREYVKENHDHIKIALEYVNHWGKYV